jgi:hypothetical protein
MSIKYRKLAEKNLNRMHIFTSYDIINNPTVDKHTRLSYCLKLARMGVRDDMLPPWCNSAEALDLFHRRTPVSLLGKPASATPGATTENPELDALAGGRRLRNRHPKKTVKKNRKRMTRKK